MASHQLPEPKRGSAVSAFGKKVVASIVLLAVAVLAIRIFVGIVSGLISTVLTGVVVVALVVAAVWAVRRL